jgi:uncharacterized membrane protein
MVPHERGEQMTETINHTTFGDAPLSTAKHPAPGADQFIGNAELSDLVGRSVTVDRPRDELYAFWRDFSALPRFMSGLHGVEVLDERRARWTVGQDEESRAVWETQIMEDVPGSLLEWRTVSGNAVIHEGRVEFRDAVGGRGTVVTATLAYHQAGGALGELWGRLFHHDPRLQTRRELRRFKQLMESGEVATSEPPYAAPRA